MQEAPSCTLSLAAGRETASLLWTAPARSSRVAAPCLQRPPEKTARLLPSPVRNMLWFCGASGLQCSSVKKRTTLEPLPSSLDWPICSSWAAPMCATDSSPRLRSRPLCTQRCSRGHHGSQLHAFCSDRRHTVAACATLLVLIPAPFGLEELRGSAHTRTCPGHTGACGSGGSAVRGIAAALAGRSREVKALQAGLLRVCRCCAQASPYEPSSGCKIETGGRSGSIF